MHGMTHYITPITVSLIPYSILFVLGDLGIIVQNV